LEVNYTVAGGHPPVNLLVNLLASQPAGVLLSMDGPAVGIDRDGRQTPVPIGLAYRYVALTESPLAEKRPQPHVPLRFCVSLYVGRALARGDLVQGAPLRLHPDVGVAREHGARDVPAMLMITSSPAPDSASSVTRVWRLSCQRPFTPAFLRTLVHAVPQRRDGLGGIVRLPLSGGEDEPFRLTLTEPPEVPRGVGFKGDHDRIVQRDHPASACVGL